MTKTINLSRQSLALGTALLAVTLAAQTAHSQNAVTAGELILEPPTLISLGFEWMIEGDDNRNARVDLSYRKAGDGSWREGLPLLRIQNERTVYDQTLDYTAPNMFAGSIFYLEPDTEYEARLRISDPDGVTGRAERIVELRTRAEPEAFSGGRVLHVYPLDHTGRRGTTVVSRLVGRLLYGGTRR